MYHRLHSMTREKVKSGWWTEQYRNKAAHKGIPYFLVLTNSIRNYCQKILIKLFLLKRRMKVNTSGHYFLFGMFGSSTTPFCANSEKHRKDNTPCGLSYIEPRVPSPLTPLLLMNLPERIKNFSPIKDLTPELLHYILMQNSHCSLRRNNLFVSFTDSDFLPTSWRFMA